MTNMRLFVQYAVPFVTGILGLIWLFGRKKGKKRRNPDSPENEKVPVVYEESQFETVVEDSTFINVAKNADVSFPPPQETQKSFVEDQKQVFLDNHTESAKTSINNISSPFNTVNAIERSETVKTESSSESNETDVSNETDHSNCFNNQPSSPIISKMNVENLQHQQFDSFSELSLPLEESHLNNISNVSNSSIKTDDEKQLSDACAYNNEVQEKLVSCTDSSNVLNLSQNLFKNDNKSFGEPLCESFSSLTLYPKKTVASDDQPILVEDMSSNQAERLHGEQLSDSVKEEKISEAQSTGDTTPTSSDSPGCDSNSEASNDSGRGGSVSSPEIVRYEFNFPSDLCGRLIGRHGKNINAIKEQTSASVALQNNPFTPEFQICVVEGTQSEVEKALALIRQKFPRSQFSQLDMSPINQPVSTKPAAPVLMPNIMQLSLPEGVSVDIVVSSIVDAGHVFVQQPTHPSFPSLERLNHFMMMCYTQDKMVPPLPQPIEAGVICVAPMMEGWYRAQVVQVYDDVNECDVKFVDYGGFERLPMSELKQIRSDFMTLPFQAVESYVANITPLQDEDFFSSKAAAVLEELTQSKLLQAQVINRAEDGIPYIHIYQINGNRVIFVNRELVNRKVTRGIEIIQ